MLSAVSPMADPPVAIQPARSPVRKCSATLSAIRSPVARNPAVAAETPARATPRSASANRGQSLAARRSAPQCVGSACSTPKRCGRGDRAATDASRCCQSSPAQQQRAANNGGRRYSSTEPELRRAGDDARGNFGSVECEATDSHRGEQNCKRILKRKLSGWARRENLTRRSGFRCRSPPRRPGCVRLR